jgi:hypothetical protein
LIESEAAGVTTIVEGRWGCERRGTVGIQITWREGKEGKYKKIEVRKGARNRENTCAVPALAVPNNRAISHIRNILDQLKIHRQNIYVLSTVSSVLSSPNY